MLPQKSRFGVKIETEIFGNISRQFALDKRTCLCITLWEVLKNRRKKAEKARRDGENRAFGRRIAPGGPLWYNVCKFLISIKGQEKSIEKQSPHTEKKETHGPHRPACPADAARALPPRQPVPSRHDPVRALLHRPAAELRGLPRFADLRLSSDGARKGQRPPARRRRGAEAGHHRPDGRLYQREQNADRRRADRRAAPLSGKTHGHRTVLLRHGQQRVGEHRDEGFACHAQGRRRELPQKPRRPARTRRREHRARGR